MTSSNPSGYDLKWLEDPPDGLKCHICKFVARNPQQHPGDDKSDCGKIFCQDCINKHQRNNANCPNCKQNLSLFKDVKSMFIYIIIKATFTQCINCFSIQVQKISKL